LERRSRENLRQSILISSSEHNHRNLRERGVAQLFAAEGSRP
jgi:hypothetical protein